jgi:hypothetical protein
VPIAPEIYAGLRGRTPYGWAGSVTSFLDLPEAEWLDALDAHCAALTRELPSRGQASAWRVEWRTLREALSELGRVASDWSLVAEFELPFEGGRRPDIVILASTAVVVLEYKAAFRITQAHTDQARAYARDLAEYHEGSHSAR